MELCLLAWQVDPSILELLQPGYRLIYSCIKKTCWQTWKCKIYSDNGSNFIGAERELKKPYSEINDDKIQSCMEGIGGDWIKWHKNPPLASHMGGVWERQIRSVCAILASMFKTHGMVSLFSH